MRALVSATLLSLSLLTTSPVFAFKCYITLMKSSCWNKHKVTFRVVDNLTEQNILEGIHLDNDKMWVRKEFQCKAAQGLIPQVRFTPHLWDSEKDREFSTKRVWFLPLTIDDNVEAWNVPICFPSDFASVPIPPTADHDCDCESTKAEIPPLPKPIPDFIKNKRR